MFKTLKKDRKTDLALFLITTCAVFLMAGCAAKSSIPVEIKLIPRVRGIIHNVKKGETLWRISKIYNVGLAELVKVNKIADKAKIHVGQKLLIPGAKRKKSVLRASSKSNNNASFIWPVKGRIISYFNQKNNRVASRGIDIQTKYGADIVSSRGGVVTFRAENLKGYGKIIIVSHDDGFVTIYAHNSQNLVKINDRVNQGTVIAKAGSSGRAADATLQFQIRRWNRAQNPLYYLP